MGATIAWAVVFASAIAHAQALPFEAVLALRHPTTVQVTAVGTDTHVAARAGRRVAEATIAVALESATAEALATTAGRVIIVRGTGAGRTYAWLVVERAGAPTIAWSGRTDLHGDPGERVADAIETIDRTGDGQPDVVVGQVRDGVSACGTPALLFPSALDASGTLRPVAISRVSGERTELAASTTSPGPTPPPIGSVLRMMGASSALGVDDAASLSAPYALTDGNPATGWIEGRSGAGPGELVIARVDAPRAVRAIALVRSTASGVVPPRSVIIVSDSGSALHVTLPETFDRAWITLPEPRAWTCMAVIIESGPSADAALHVGLGEIEAYTELDFGGGIASLVDALVAEGSDAEHTADWLRGIGVPAIVAIDAAWDRLSVLGHRRAVRVAAARASSDEGHRLLVRAANDDDAEVRADAIAASMRAGTAGASVLAEVASGTGPGADDAARVLAVSALDYDVSPLLHRLHEGAVDRGPLREAIGARFRRPEHAAADAALASFRADASPSALASAALGLSRDAPTLARDLIEQASPLASEFADRYRLALAARNAERSETSDRWLSEIALHAEEWMLRDTALRALALRSAAAITSGLADASPRVRTTTVTLLAADPSSTQQLIDRASSDPWPMVRVAALESLAHRDEEITTLYARLADASPMVRERAIRLLTARADRGAWPLLAPIFADDDEWPRVTAAALEFASTLCVEGAGDAIVQVLRRGAREGAWAPLVDVAVEALRVAIRLGGPVADQARAIATRSTNEAFGPVLAGQGALPACGEAAVP